MDSPEPLPVPEASALSTLPVMTMVGQYAGLQASEGSLPSLRSVSVMMDVPVEGMAWAERQVALVVVALSSSLVIFQWTRRLQEVALTLEVPTVFLQEPE